MKRLIVLLLISLPLMALQTPASWVYLNPQAVADIAPYNEALAKSDLDKYRYFDKRNTLHFENGLDVELLSANELIAAGIPVNTSHVRTQEPAFDTRPLFRLTSGGILVEVQTRNKVK